MLLGNLKPHPISEVGVEESTWMETIASLDHLTGLTIIEVHTLEDVLGWEVVVDEVEVFEFHSFVDEILVNFGKVFGKLSCVFSCCFISIQPTSTRTNL